MKISLFLLLFVTLSYANTAKIKAEFKEFFYSNNVHDRLCQDNTRAFVRHLAKKNIFNSNIKLVHLEAPSHAWTFGRLPAFNSRFGKFDAQMYIQNWTYHFFMILDGEVYDFSFGQKPQILSTKKYMDKMYLPKKDYMINGPSFRTRGMGPYFTRERAKIEREDFIFQVYKTDKDGDKINFLNNLSYKEFISSPF